MCGTDVDVWYRGRCVVQKSMCGTEVLRLLENQISRMRSSIVSSALCGKFSFEFEDSAWLGSGKSWFLS